MLTAECSPTGAAPPDASPRHRRSEAITDPCGGACLPARRVHPSSPAGSDSTSPDLVLHRKPAMAIGVRRLRSTTWHLCTSIRKHSVEEASCQSWNKRCWPRAGPTADRHGQPPENCELGLAFRLVSDDALGQLALGLLHGSRAG